jgi:glycosyltransferase involved in cell wall biosynthesis
MRILHVVGALNRGGAETWLVEVLKNIDRREFQMDFLVHSWDQGAFDEEVKELGSRVIVCLKPSNPIQYAYNFCRILRESGPYDCIHSHIHQYSGYVLFLATMMGIPVRIAHSHNGTRAIDRASSAMRKAYIAIMDAMIRRFATEGIAVSEKAAASLFSDTWKADTRWKLCPLGIDLSEFGRTVDRREVRTQLKIPMAAFVVGHVGRFFAQKNHCFLVDVAEQVCRLEPRAVFLLVGDGPLRPQVETVVQARGLSNRFVFTGIRSDVPRMMKGVMDCFLFPSIYEGLGLVLWEAQAAGIPCIAADTVPEEADAGIDLLRTLSLTSPAQHWAEAVVESRSRTRPDPAVVFPQRLTIGESARRLRSLYTAAMEKPN